MTEDNYEGIRSWFKDKVSAQQDEEKRLLDTLTTFAHDYEQLLELFKSCIVDTNITHQMLDYSIYSHMSTGKPIGLNIKALRISLPPKELAILPRVMSTPEGIKMYVEIESKSAMDKLAGPILYGKTGQQYKWSISRQPNTHTIITPNVAAIIIAKALFGLEPDF